MSGNGANELVVATSQKELAAYDAQGKRLWNHVYDGDIHDLIMDDLDGDGRMEAIAHLDTEKLHRVNGDGSERPVADVNTVYTRGVNIFSMGVWAPEDPKKKDVMLWCGEPSAFMVLPDGTVKQIKSYAPQASMRLANIVPNEPEAIVGLSSYGFNIVTARRDADGNFIRVGSRPVTGSNSGNEASPPGVLRQFCKLLLVDAHGTKWLVGAVASGLNCYPIEAFVKDSKDTRGWQYNTGSPCGTAVLAEDVYGNGAPEVLLARQDGFINTFRLADGTITGRIEVGEPIIGMAMLKGKDGKAYLAVGTKFSVQLFAPDAADKGFKLVGKNTLASPAASFAGPGGANKDRVFVVDSGGNVTVFVVKQ